MTRKDYDAFCATLPHATHVVQWGDASVWKIGGKVFAIGGWSHGEAFAVTFKCSKTSFAILSELPGLRPAPYLASRGTFMDATHRRQRARRRGPSGLSAAKLLPRRRRLAEANPARAWVAQTKRTPLNRRSVGIASHARSERQLDPDRRRYSFHDPFRSCANPRAHPPHPASRDRLADRRAPLRFR